MRGPHAFGWVALALAVALAWGPATAGGARADAASADPVERDAGESPPEAEYDPFEGMDRNGRIPKVPMPKDIAHPERWRYIPEGRIKPGNVFQRFLVSSFISPSFFFNSDVGFGLGAGITDIDFRTQRRREFAGAFFSYTTRGQQAYTVAWRRWLKTRDLPTGGVIQEERSFVSARFGFSKTLTRRFFGFGADQKESDESSYTDAFFDVSVGGAYSLSGALDDVVLEFGVGGEFHDLSDGTVSGAPTLKQAYPLVFQADNISNLGVITFGVRWDTRDSQRNPYRGFYVAATGKAGVLQSGWDAGSVFRLASGVTIPVPGLFHNGGDEGESHPPTDTFALGLFTSTTAGEMPFMTLPTLGGSRTLRGYIRGRWRDRSAWHGSAEYRVWVLPRGFSITKNIRVERVGVAGFYDVGSVADEWPDLFSARVAHSPGVGLRVSLERAALFRFDFGFSEDGFNIATGFGVSF